MLGRQSAARAGKQPRPDITLVQQTQPAPVIPAANALGARADALCVALRHSSSWCTTPIQDTQIIEDVALTLAGMARWARGRDPILQRYGVGGLARVAGGGAAGFEAVQAAGGLDALVRALTCADPQTQCFAAGALGARAPSSSGDAGLLNLNGMARLHFSNVI